MGLITRQTKAGSTDGNYVPNVIIQSAEVNVDFNQVYELVDGDIDNANIAANANISASKLNLVDAIGPAQLQANAVTTAKIADGAVTLAKLAVNATNTNLVVGSVPANTLVTTTETTLFDTSSFTSRGSFVLLMGTAMFFYQAISELPPRRNRLTVRIYSIVTAPVPSTTLLRSLNLQPLIETTVAGGAAVELPASVPFALLDEPAAGDTTLYRVTVQSAFQQASPLSAWRTSDANAGDLIGLQLA